MWLEAIELYRSPVRNVSLQLLLCVRGGGKEKGGQDEAASPV